MRSASRPGVATRMSIALVERLDLRLVGQAAGHELVAQARDVDERLERVAHLHRQLAGRHEDEGARTPALGACAVGEPGDHRQAEGEGLAGPRAGTAEDVSPGDGVGDGLLLDRERVGDAVARQALDEDGEHPEGREAVVAGDLLGGARGGRVAGPGVGLGALRLRVLEGVLRGAVCRPPAVGRAVVATEAAAGLGAAAAAAVAAPVVGARAGTVVTALVAAPVTAPRVAGPVVAALVALAVVAALVGPVTGPVGVPALVAVTASRVGDPGGGVTHGPLAALAAGTLVVRAVHVPLLATVGHPALGPVAPVVALRGPAAVVAAPRC